MKAVLYAVSADTERFAIDFMQRSCLRSASSSHRDWTSESTNITSIFSPFPSRVRPSSDVKWHRIVRSHLSRDYELQIEYADKSPAAQENIKVRKKLGKIFCTLSPLAILRQNDCSKLCWTLQLWGCYCILIPSWSHHRKQRSGIVLSNAAAGAQGIQKLQKLGKQL